MSDLGASDPGATKWPGDDDGSGGATPEGSLMPSVLLEGDGAGCRVKRSGSAVSSAGTERELEGYEAAVMEVHCCSDRTVAGEGAVPD